MTPVRLFLDCLSVAGGLLICGEVLIFLACQWFYIVAGRKPTEGG